MNTTIERTLAAATLITTTILSSASFANPVQCTYGTLTRTIEVVYSDPGQPVPCEVIYHKPMQSSVQTLWRANSEAGYCESQAEALIDKLSNFAWRCESVDGSAAAQLPAELRLEDEMLGDAPAADDEGPH